MAWRRLAAGGWAPGLTPGGGRGAWTPGPEVAGEDGWREWWRVGRVVGEGVQKPMAGAARGGRARGGARPPAWGGRGAGPGAVQAREGRGRARRGGGAAMLVAWMVGGRVVMTMMGW